MIVQGVPALSFDESASFSAPAAFGTYRVLHQIGSGVLGPVFRTYDPQRDRLVAVKAFRLDIVPEDVARLADSLRKLVAARLTHPHIVPAIEAGLEGTTAFLAMDYVSGETLDVALRHLAPSTLDRAEPVLSSIAGAIEAAWAAGFGHGALHPRDVFLVAGTDDVMVTGFGVLPSLEAAGIKAPGRRPYSAPERAAGEPWDIRADVYSLGAIAHELLTRRRPAGSGEQDGSFATGMTPEQRVWIRKILAAALAERPANRFATPTAFAEAIAAVARGDAPAALPEVVDVAPAEAEAIAVEPETRDRGRRKPTPASPLFEAMDTAPEAAASVAPVAVEATSDAAPAETAPEISRPIAAGPEAPEEVVADASSVATDEASASASAETLIVESTPFVAAPINEPPVAAPISANAGSPLGLSSSPTRPTPLQTPPPRRPAMIAEPDAFRTRLPAAPLLPPASEKEPYPWLAIAAGVIAGIAIGVVGGYQLGTSHAASTPQSAAVVPAPVVGPGTPTDTDVKVAPEKPGEAKPAETKAAEPKPSAPAPTGRVTVRSTPSGASISIDGQPRVTSPASIKDLAMGEHTAVVSRSGYVTRTEKFTLTPSSASKDLSVTLQAVAAPKTPSKPASSAKAPPAAPKPAAGATTGTITFDSRPRGATVFVDGRSIGVTPTQSAKVAPGSHAVRIELSGYKTLTTSVVVKAGETTPIAVSLELRGDEPRLMFKEKR